MSECFFEIPDAGISAKIIQEEIVKKISEKEKTGIYETFYLSKDATPDFLDATDENQFMKYYLNVKSHVKDALY